MIGNKSLFVFLLCQFYSLCIYSQVDSFFDAALKVSQKGGSNEKLSTYFSQVDAQSDTVYAYLYQPGVSPRLEHYLSSFDRELKQVSPCAETVIISVGKNQSVSEAYNKRMGYKADYYIYDEENTFLDFLSFKTLDLAGVYVLKVAVESGRLIYGGGVMCNEDEYFKALVETIQPEPYFSYAERARSKSLGLPEDIVYAKLRYLSFGLDAKDIMFTFPPAMKNGRLAISDDLNSEVAYFEIDNGNVFMLMGTCKVSDEEKDMYINLDDKDKRILKENNMAYYMPCSVSFLDNGCSGISYSIPFAEYKVVENDTIVALYNQPVIIVRDSLLRQCAPMKYEDAFFGDGYLYNTVFYFPLGGELMAIACRKYIWPLNNTEEFKGIPDKDSFMAEFYDCNNPYMVMVDMKSGKKLCRFGHLSDLARQTMTGYFFNSGVADGFEGDMVYSDGFDGKVFLASVLSPDEVNRVYEVFGHDMDSMPVPDKNKFYTLEYGSEYVGFFQRQIQTLRLTGSEIHCLIKIRTSVIENEDKPAYEYVRIDRESGDVVSRYVIDKQYPDEEIMGCKFSWTRNSFAGDGFCPLPGSSR